MRLPAIIATSCLLFAFVSCASEGPPPPARQEVGIQSTALGGTRNVTRLGNIWFAGQPDVAGLHEAHQAGIRTVVNLRSTPEMVGNPEERTVAKLGMEYINIPFRAATTLSDQIFERARFILRSPDHRPMLLHCKSGNRVGAVWYAHRVLDCGISTDAAMAEALAIGLRKKGHIHRAKDYVAGQLKTLNK